ncbi:hypothetical protein IscW_ISCW004812 [Ixodes scapularis]|uniref:Uncharacterized protein n=1 Tax=Ixodes scapularis TaxID=6945 RepID=B7PEQ2_IXOSC|nr:hypothetical protein IscW_ISCW004812 [Ixodes scapularis]|eukprot:XP_002433674.1 hypothetical protein IscW_ISCW004812 [Ixodes scapularis]
MSGSGGCFEGRRGCPNGDHPGTLGCTRRCRRNLLPLAPRRRWPQQRARRSNHGTCRGPRCGTASGQGWRASGAAARLARLRGHLHICSLRLLRPVRLAARSDGAAAVTAIDCATVVCVRAVGTENVHGYRRRAMRACGTCRLPPRDRHWRRSNPGRSCGGVDGNTVCPRTLRCRRDDWRRSCLYGDALRGT